METIEKNTDFDEESFYAEWAKEEDKLDKERTALLKSFRKQLNGLINHRGLFKYLNESQDGWSPISIVEIELTDKKMSGYGDTQCCVEKGGGSLYLKVRCDDVNKIDHYYVIQWTSFEDSYSGFLLYPISDGRYFKVSFAC